MVIHFSPPPPTRCVSNAFSTLGGSLSDLAHSSFCLRAIRILSRFFFFCFFEFFGVLNNPPTRQRTTGFFCLPSPPSLGFPLSRRMAGRVPVDNARGSLLTQSFSDVPNPPEDGWWGKTQYFFFHPGRYHHFPFFPLSLVTDSPRLPLSRVLER